jgi:peptidyl-prolyl cis-trans isomerase SurA
MNEKIKFIILQLCLFALGTYGLGFSPVLAQEVPTTAVPNSELSDDQVLEVDKVIASVDGEPFTLYDLKERVSPSLAKVSQPVQSNEGLVKRAAILKRGMEELLLEKVLEKEAGQSGIRVNDEEVDAYISEIKRQNRVDDAGFAKILNARGLSIEQYRKDVRLDIIRGRIISKRMGSKINIVDEDIDRYLEEQSSLIPEKNTLKLHIIRYRFSDYPEKSETELREMVSKVREAVLAGEKLRSVDPTHFEDLGYVKREELKKDLREMIEGYSVGEIGEISRQGDSFVFFEIAGQVDEKGKVDDTLRAQIRETLYRERYEEEVARFLNEELPKKYHIETKM